MDLNLAPFNITLLPNTRDMVRNLEPITSTDIFEGSSKKLNDNGLFSTTVFGRVGEERRANTFAYIDLRTKIIHAILYNNIEKVASFYIGIIEGKNYAKWDDKEKAFVESDQVDGETGFSFFMKHYSEIKFVKNESERRNMYIDVLDKFRNTAIYDFVLVIPAGIRDIEEDKAGGKLKQGEINEYYRNLIGLSKNIDTTFKDNKFNDGTKLLMQRNFNSIYNLLFSYLDGKRGITQDKFAKRKVENGTRSVFAIMDLAVEDMRAENSLGMDDSIVGLFQGAKGILPLVQHAFKGPLVQATFIGDSEVRVINPKTMKTEVRSVDSRIKARYTTEDGVVDWVNKFEEQGIRDKPIMISGGYLAMVYRDERGFKIIKEMDNVPEGKIDQLKPITYAEFLYYLIHGYMAKSYGWITRFPYAGVESTVPSRVHLRTTEKATLLKEYDYNWQITDESPVFPEWPTVGSSYIETIQVHPSRLKGYGADFDGKKVSL